MKNQIVDLRNHLFATLEALQDKDNPMDLDRAKTIATVSGQLIASAKVEVEFIKATGSVGSGFIPDALPKPNGAVDGKSQQPALSEPAVRVHRLK